MKNTFFNNYFCKISKLLNDISFKELNKIYDLILKTSKKKGKILIFGNGGNISTAAHFATDMTKNAKIKTMVFNDPNLITCFSNDYGFNQWVKKTIEYYGSKKDLIILLSVSGESQNLVNAAKYCKKNKINCISISGFKRNNSLSRYAKISLWINSKSYNLVEIIQMTILLSFIDKKIGSLTYKSNL